MEKLLASLLLKFNTAPWILNWTVRSSSRPSQMVLALRGLLPSTLKVRPLRTKLEPIILRLASRIVTMVY